VDTTGKSAVNPCSATFARLRRGRINMTFLRRGENDVRTTFSTDLYEYVEAMSGLSDIWARTRVVPIGRRFRYTLASRSFQSIACTSGTITPTIHEVDGQRTEQTTFLRPSAQSLARLRHAYDATMRCPGNGAASLVLRYIGTNGAFRTHCAGWKRCK